MLQFIFPIIFLVILVYRYTRMPKEIANLYEPSREILNPNGHMKIHTVNGCGVKSFGHFRQNGETYVTYQFLSILYFPIIPIGAYRIRDLSNDRYSVYGSVQSFSLEILSIYISWYGAVLLLASLFIAFLNVEDGKPI